MNATLIVILLTFAFAALSAVIALRFYWNTGRVGIRLQRGSLTSGTQILGQQASVLVVILAVGLLTDLDFYSLGVSRSFDPLSAFAIGFLVYFLVLAVVEGGSRLLGIRERLQDMSYETMRLLWPRQKSQKLAAIVGVCLLNPFTEEVLYRGVLIHLLGDYTENLVLAVVVGFLLSIAAHMYQGAWSIPFQGLFHGTAVLLVLSPMGLVACFGFHVAGDLVPVALLRRSMYEWRERRRRDRAIAD